MKNLHRLKRNKDFQRVFQHGNSTANRQFVIYQLKDPTMETFRFGMSVSKRIGNAVARNRVKRCIREVVRQLEGQIYSGRDYVIIARKPTADMSFHEMKSSLIHVFGRARALQSKGRKT
jgi:ribonuclease P protein component